MNEISLPIANTGSVAIHDTTFHYGGIFFPQVSLVAGLVQSELVLQFIDSLDDKNLKLKSILFDETVLNIDSALGNFSSSYLNRTQKINPAWILSREGLSATEYLEWFIIAICKKYENIVPRDNLKLMKDASISGQYKINLSIDRNGFYQLTESRTREVALHIRQAEQ